MHIHLQHQKLPNTKAIPITTPIILQTNKQITI